VRSSELMKATFMKAFVIKDQQGRILRAWLTRDSLPRLDFTDAQLLRQRTNRLEEVAVETALRGASEERRCERSRAASARRRDTEVIES